MERHPLAPPRSVLRTIDSGTPRVCPTGIELPYSFTADHEAELREHLAGNDERAVNVALTIWGYACSVVSHSLKLDANPEYGAHAQAMLRHSGEVLEHAEGLQHLIRLNGCGLTDDEIQALEKALRKVTRAAARCQSQQGAALRKPRGRPVKVWRDELIALVFHSYAPGEAERRSNSHFEQTVEVILGYLGQEVEDVHGTISTALEQREARRAQGSGPLVSALYLGRSGAAAPVP